MNAKVIYEGFTHRHHLKEVAEQEYEAANVFYDSVLLQDWTNDDAQEKFRAAVERREVARERYLSLLDEC